MRELIEPPYLEPISNLDGPISPELKNNALDIEDLLFFLSSFMIYPLSEVDTIFQHPRPE